VLGTATGIQISAEADRNPKPSSPAIHARLAGYDLIGRPRAEGTAIARRTREHGQPRFIVEWQSIWQG
jgi:hypothetical protein